MTAKYPLLTPAALNALFNEEAARASRDFPLLANRLIIADPAHDQMAVVVDASRLRLTSEEELQRIIAAIRAQTGKVTRSECTILQGIFVITLAAHVTRDNAMFGLPHQQEVLTVFDHEIGHHVVQDAFHGIHKNYKENAADTYALLRAQQRGGEEAYQEAFNRIRFTRCAQMALKGRWTYFSTPTLTALDNMRHTVDIARLTPQQTAILAGRLALAHAPNDLLLSRLESAFSPAVTAYALKDDNLQRAALALADLMIATGNEDPAVFSTGKVVIDGLRAGYTLCGQSIALDNPRWPLLLKTIDAMAKKLGDDALVAGLPRPSSVKLPGMYSQGR